jgi:hypothetical protein
VCLSGASSRWRSPERAFKAQQTPRHQHPFRAGSWGGHSSPAPTDRVCGGCWDGWTLRAPQRTHAGRAPLPGHMASRASWPRPWAVPRLCAVPRLVPSRSLADPRPRAETSIRSSRAAYTSTIDLQIEGRGSRFRVGGLWTLFIKERAGGELAPAKNLSMMATPIAQARSALGTME